MAALFLALATQFLSHQSPPAQDPKSGITEKEAIDFAVSLQKDFRQGKADALKLRFDADYHVNVAERGIGLKAKYLRKLKDEFVTLVIPGDQFLPTSGVSFTLVRARTLEEASAVLFRRVRDPDLSYYEFLLRRLPDGTIRVFDILFYSVGETLSAQTRRMALAFADVDIDLVDSLKGVEKLISENYVRLTEMGSEAMKGRPQRAFDLYAILPASLQGQPFVQNLRLFAATRSGALDCAKVQDEIEKKGLGPTIAPMIVLAAQSLRNRHEEVLREIDRLDRILGGDPFLNHARGERRLMLKRSADAAASARRMIDDFPSLPHGFWLLVRVFVLEKAYKEAAAVLVPFEKKFGAVSPAFFQDAEFTEFVKSAEFQDWMKSRTTK